MTSMAAWRGIMWRKRGVAAKTNEKVSGVTILGGKIMKKKISKKKKKKRQQYNQACGRASSAA